MSGEQDPVQYLVGAYGISLKHQIEARGSNLACSDEDLCVQMRALLSEDPRETHCLGLDPLRTMEESLQDQATSSATAPVRRETRRGLDTLERAFRVLEQAALNLYVAPWREEYKVVKMYSGVFAHVVKPALSGTQIQSLFGLLGYEPSATRREQLQLRPHRVGSASSEELLRLSCAFFLARCECRLLLDTLGKHSGDPAWQLGVVRERRRGHTLQACLDLTHATLAEQHMTTFRPGESDVDLYTDPAVNGEHKHLDVPEEGGPTSLAWETINAPGGQESHPPTSYDSSSPQVCVSTLNYQLSSPLSLDPTGSGSGTACAGEGSSPGMLLDTPDGQCACLRTCLYVRRCVDCDQLHDVSCPSMRRCSSQGHCVLTPNGLGDSLPEQSFRDSNPPTSPCSSAALSSLTLCDDPAMAPSHPISFHDCCEVARPDPQYVCVSCNVFHSRHCKRVQLCRDKHELRSLGVCGCSSTCNRKPLVLCRYCGTEYCNTCWYRSPLTCVCGRLFENSSSV